MILHAESQATELRETQAALARLRRMLVTFYDGRNRDENPNIDETSKTDRNIFQYRPNIDYGDYSVERFSN